MEDQQNSKLLSYELAKRDRPVPFPRKRRALDEQQSLYLEVMKLRRESLTYSRIADDIELRYKVRLPKATISDWVTRRQSPMGRANSFDSRPRPELAYVIGVEAGDGSLNFNRYNYRIRLKANDKEFVEEFNRCLSRILSTARHKIWKARGTGEYQLDVSSFMLYHFLRRPLEELRPWIEHDLECVSAFLRGFFDSEGCASKEGVVTASNTNQDLLGYVRWLLLEKVGIETTGPRIKTKKGSVLIRRGRSYLRKSDCFEIYVRARHLARFDCEVGFMIVRKNLRVKKALLMRARASQSSRLEAGAGGGIRTHESLRTKD
jgi:intein-encoded DNA endonuclease-like protein